MRKMTILSTFMNLKLLNAKGNGGTNHPSKKFFNMKNYIVKYCDTVCFSHPLESIKTKPSHWVYEKDFEKLEDALTFAEQEEKACTLTKVSDLDFCPTDEERNKYVTFVDVLEVNYDEDGEIEDTDVVDRKNVIEFWIED